MEEVKGQLEALGRHEAMLDAELEILINQSSYPSVPPRIPTQTQTRLYQQLTSQLDIASQAASSVSDKVKRLDEAQQRLRDTLERVDVMLDLKVTVETVRNAISEDNLDIAARHLNRMLAPLRSSGKNIPTAFSVLEELEATVAEKVSNSCQAIGIHLDALPLSLLYPMLRMPQPGLSIYSQIVSLPISTTKHRDIVSLLDTASDILHKHMKILQNTFGRGSQSHLLAFVRKQVAEITPRLASEFVKSKGIESIVNKAQLMLRMKSGNATGAMAVKVDSSLLEELAVMISDIEDFAHGIDVGISSARKDSLEEGLVWEDDMGGSRELLETSQTLQSYYIVLEEVYMVVSIDTALEMEEIINEEGYNVRSTLVDDVLYILKRSTGRAFSMRNINTACAAVNLIGNILMSNFFTPLKARCSQVMHSQSDDLQAFVFLNNFSRCHELIKLLKMQLATESMEVFGDSEYHREMFTHCLAQLSQLAIKFAKLADKGLAYYGRIVTSGLKPQMEVFAHLDYRISQEDFTDFEITDPFSVALISALDSSLTDPRKLLEEDNYATLIRHIGLLVCSQLESLLLQKKFSFWGGLQFHKDVREISGFFADQSHKPVRDIFEKLFQASTLLQLETLEELSEYDQTAWGSAEALQSLINLRVDFSTGSLK